MFSTGSIPRLMLMSLSACVFAGLYGVSGYDDVDGDHSTRDRLVQIEKKLDVLSNELDRLTDTGPQEAQSARSEPVGLVSADRTSGLDGTIFTVNYTKNVAEVFYIATVGDTIIVSGFDVEESEGHSTLRFTCGGAETVRLAFSDKSSELTLVLDNAGSRARQQLDFTVPTLDIHHEGDLVYEPGTDVKVEVSSSSGEQWGFSDVQTSLIVVQGGHELQYADHWIEVLDRKEFLRSQELRLLISTAEHPGSGFFRAGLSFWNPDALVKGVHLQRSLVLRPSNQTGPYPDDYLALQGVSPSSDHGPIVNETCQVGSNCTFRCSAVGAITSMAVNRLAGDGEHWESVEDVTQLVFDYSRTAEWSVRPTEDMGDQRFKCVVESAVKSLTLDTQVTILSEHFYIDINSSTIYVEEDQPGPDSGLLRINCSIRGRPVLQGVVMLLFQNTSASTSNYALHPRYIQAQVVPVGPGVSVATAAVRYDPFATAHEGFVGARCIASSTNHRYDMVDIPWSTSSD